MPVTIVRREEGMVSKGGRGGSMSVEGTIRRTQEGSMELSITYIGRW